jgi:HlyD family secretion protein
VSSLLSSPNAAGHSPEAPKRGPRSYLGIIIAVILCAALAALGRYLYLKSLPNSQVELPTVKVVRGDVFLTIFAKGEIRGGNSQVLTAPMTGGDLHVLFLLPNASQVKPGDVVVRFDPTDQEFALKEAQSDLAEAEQHIKQATAQREADTEEDRYALEQAQTNLELAELEARKNPILAAITAKQNDLAVAVAKDKLAQLKQDRVNKQATDEAGVQMQQAGEGKAQSKILTAHQNIEAMTLRAERAGYVAIKQNSNVNMIYDGMQLPIFQVGDAAQPGMAMAEIPDLNHWEVAANVGELDRGHLSPGDKVNVTVIALPNRTFHGRVTDIGSTSGAPWDRHFECKITLDDQSPNLRPGMTARVEITTETMHNVLWIPAQALFESEGKAYVYLQSGKTFARHDVTLVRRNETKVILTGLNEGQQVALANPADAVTKKTKPSASPLEVIPK